MAPSNKNHGPEALGESFYGDVRQLKDGNRLVIPKDVLRAVGWAESKHDLGLVAELVQPGRVRLHRADSIQPWFDTTRERLAVEVKKGDQDSAEELAGLMDKFRPVTLYSDGRVRLTEAVLVFLGVTPGENPYLYIRQFNEFVEVLSAAARNDFLARRAPER